MLSFMLSDKSFVNAHLCLFDPASPRMAKLINYSIIPDTNSSNKFSLQFRVGCSGWPIPNISLQLCRSDSDEWNSFDKVMHVLPAPFKTSLVEEDSTGIPLNTVDAKIDFSWDLFFYKLRLFCWNEHGNRTSDEIKFIGMFPFYTRIVDSKS